MAFFPAEHWDASVEEWDKTIENRNFPHYFYYYEADLYIDDVLKDSKLALELGAGTCGSTLRHVSENARIVALDYSAAMLHVGRAAFSENPVGLIREEFWATRVGKCYSAAEDSAEAFIFEGMVLIL